MVWNDKCDQGEEDCECGTFNVAKWRDPNAVPIPINVAEEVERVFPKFEADVCDVYENAQRVLLKKHQDYGPKNISGSPGGPLNGLRVRMHDKLARINNLVDSGAEPENESLRDSFLDCLNYCAIALMVLDNLWPES